MLASALCYGPGLSVKGRCRELNAMTFARRLSLLNPCVPGVKRQGKPVFYLYL